MTATTRTRSTETRARGRKGVPAKKASRGSYAVIGPATRAKILNAALKCILTHGYQGTTTLLVQKMAKVSRGSLLNQFPTKADLMAALSEEIIHGRTQTFTDRLAVVSDFREKFAVMMDIQWDLLKQPGGIARLEITIAAISDPDLMKRFAPQNRAMDQDLRDKTWASAVQLGISDRVAVDNVITQSMAALRGLAIDLIYPRPGCDVEAAFVLIKQTHMDAIDRLIAAGRRADRAPR